MPPGKHREGRQRGQEEEEQRGRNRNDKGKKKIIQRNWHLGQATLDTFDFYPHVNVKSPLGNTHCFW